MKSAAPPDSVAQFTVGPWDDPDRYVVGPPVSMGGEGVVYRGHHRGQGMDGELAIKALHHDGGGLADAALGVRREVELLRSASHPGVVQVRDGFLGPPIHHEPMEPSSDRDSIAYVVMDWVEGENLATLGRRTTSLDERWGLVGGLGPVACAVDALATGRETGGVPLVHGDIKPDNIIQQPDGRTVLVDFGVAAKPGLHAPGVGTPGYRLPPGENWSPGRADTYALSGVVFHLITSTTPPDQPSAFRRALRHCGVPKARAALIAAPREIDLAPPPSAAGWLAAVSTPDARSGVRRRALAGALATGALVLLAAMLWMTTGGNDVRPRCSPDDAAAEWSAAASEAAVPLSWLDRNGDCAHDLLMGIDSARAAAVAAHPAEQVAVLSEAIAGATTLEHIDYSRCEAETWATEAARYAASAGLNITWTDRDSDCLHDTYEMNALGLDPDNADSDGDGAVDSLDMGPVPAPFAQAPDGQLEYLWGLYELDSDLPVADPTHCDPAEWALVATKWGERAAEAAPWRDPDGDCLDSGYEERATGTDPNRADSDGDGIGDATDPDSSNGFIEAIDTQMSLLGRAGLNEIPLAEQDDRPWADDD